MSTPTATIPSLDSTLLRDQCYIGGVWRAARSGRTFAVTNPANGARVGEVPDCEPADVETAIVRITQMARAAGLVSCTRIKRT